MDLKCGAHSRCLVKGSQGRLSCCRGPGTEAGRSPHFPRTPRRERQEVSWLLSSSRAPGTRQAGAGAGWRKGPGGMGLPPGLVQPRLLPPIF